MEHASQIREWPAEERPRERLYHKGAAALSDGELLAIQLGTGIRGMSALDVAHGLLAQFGTLQELAGREVAEVAGVRGVGRAKAVRLASAFEITRRLRSRNGHARPVLSSPEQVFARYAPLMEDLRKEIFRLALLDSQNGLLRDIVVSEGTLSIILLHNHPSGDPTPSREDLRLTRQLVECSKLLDLRIHDHVIIGRERFISLAQRGNL